MSGIEQATANLKNKCGNTASKTKDPLELLQAKMLARGPATFKTFQRRFLIMDDDRSKTLNYEEFKYGLQDIKVYLNDEIMRNVFQEFDRDGSGSIDMTEFLVSLRPKMNQGRHNLVVKCFALMDKTGDGIITMEDLVGCYNVTKHTKYLSGEWSERKVYEEFLKTFEAENHKDGMVDKEEFLSYYEALSAGIDDDAYFRLMMRNSWKHLDKDGVLN